LKYCLKSGKIFLVKIILKIKNFQKSLEILYRVWKHIFGKNYFENPKIQVSKFDSKGQKF